MCQTHICSWEHKELSALFPYDIPFFQPFLTLQVLEDVRRIVSQADYVPRDRRELCGRLFHTVYMASENSSQETKARAKLLSQQIGRYSCS